MNRWQREKALKASRLGLDKQPQTPQPVSKIYAWNRPKSQPMHYTKHVPKKVEVVRKVLFICPVKQRRISPGKFMRVK